MNAVVPVIYGDEEFRSISLLSKAIGIKASSLRNHLRKGELNGRPFYRKGEEPNDATEPLTAPLLTIRRCMCCLDKFESEGKHNRLCNRCRQLG